MSRPVRPLASRSDALYLDHVDDALGADPWQLLRLGLVEEIVEAAQLHLRLQASVASELSRGVLRRGAWKRTTDLQTVSLSL